MPPAGSPVETLFLLVWRMNQEIEFQKSRALIQALLDQEGVKDPKRILNAFSDLSTAFFPFEQNAKQSEEKKLREILAREIARGPLAVMVTEEIGGRKWAAKLKKGNESLKRRAALLQENQMTPLDPFEMAKKRLSQAAF